jgi:hypothetical protein
VLNKQPLLQPKRLPNLNPLDFQVRADCHTQGSRG